MKRKRLFSIAIFVVLLFAIVSVFYKSGAGLPSSWAQAPKSAAKTTNIVTLPSPLLDGSLSVERALSERRSVRAYRNQPLTMADISQILWAAQGITEPKRGLRTAPSARASYLLKVYLLAGRVTDLSMGMYEYQPLGHRLVRIAAGDIKTKLFASASQEPIRQAPAAIVIAGLSNKAKNHLWMYLEAGHVSQNIYLEAVSRNMGTVTMAGFDPEEVKKALKLPYQENPIYIMPLGKK
ncbi:MAG: Nitroreductase family protein [Syntrophus sp. PtaB.Bin001]|nr:MAG: Nitroreductase family protein [Syntrophus sp. PtaB.Bin001]